MCQCCVLQSKEMVWEVTRSFPPVRACLFSQSLTVITFLGDPSAGSGLPRGTMVFANQPIPKEVRAFCFFLFVCLFIVFVNTLLSQWEFLPWEIWGRFPQEKPAATESRYLTLTN